MVTDLHQASLDKKASRGKKRRVYIGDGSRLLPRRISSICDDDLPSSLDLGTPTSTLTSVSDTEQEENAINEGEFTLSVVAGGVDSEYSTELNQFSPACLCDDDVTRALMLGLHAVGVLAIVEEPSQPTSPRVPPALTMSHPVYASNLGVNSQLASAISTLSIPDGSKNLLQNKTTDQTEELASLSMPPIVSLTGASIQQDQAIIGQVSPRLGHQCRTADAPLPLADCNAPPPSMRPDLPPPQFSTFLPPTDSAPLPAEFGASLSSVDLGVPPPAEPDASPRSAGSLQYGTPSSEEFGSFSLLPQWLTKGTITTDVTSTLASFNLDCPTTTPQPPQLTERPATTSKPQEPTPSLSTSSPKTTSLNGSLNSSMQHERSMSASHFLHADDSPDKGDACHEDTVTSQPSPSVTHPNFTPHNDI